MRFFSILINMVLLYACTTSTAGNGKEKEAAGDESHSKKITVELFTSQGCSSCPSADKLVSNLAQSDTDLIVLSFHVDYWDRLGWKDVFSNHDYTVRQQQYAQALHAESVYTPQAVVQGQFEMVGSNQSGITNALQKAREEKNDIELNGSAVVNNSTVTVSCKVNKVVADKQIVTVLIQKQASTQIARGENSGIMLAGYNVVRNLLVMPLTKSNITTRLSLPADLQKSNASVVVFVQDISSKKISAVTQLSM